ncbi:MAG TPA: DUF4394 domain-containing protein, partial [Polyangiales bacterium]|nr:DUF4394 domain-containing protein [Polyangiales bacterium]
AAQGLIRIGGDPASGGSCDAPNPDAGNPNCGVVRAVGPLGVSDVQVQGFDIDGKTGAGWAVLGAGAASLLYGVDLTSGKAGMPLGTIGGGAALRSFTLTRDPVARGVALTSDARLLTFDLKTPGVPLSNVALLGEQLLGIDVRPADGKLYAFGVSGKLYTLDRESGVLAAVGGKGATLAASAYGVDWNPVADALRVVGSDGANLRLPGAMLDLPMLDSALNPGTPAVVAAAYNRNYAGSTATTLYVIDADRDFLYLQGGSWGAPSPNTGALTPIGALGVDAQGEVAFDIVGGHDGLALAAIRTADKSELYSVDLARGWATPLNMTDNAIGGTAPIVGIAVDLR